MRAARFDLVRSRAGFWCTGGPSNGSGSGMVLNGMAPWKDHEIGQTGGELYFHTLLQGGSLI